MSINQRKQKKWTIAKVVSKSKDNNGTIHNIDIFGNRELYKLRDLSDFHWRYNDLYECNKYLLAGYKVKTKMVRLLDTSNVKKIYEHIESPSEEVALLKLFKNYNFITEQDILNEDIEISYHKKNNRSNGKAYLKLVKQDILLCEFWYSIRSLYIDDCDLPKTWSISLIRKIDK